MNRQQRRKSMKKMDNIFLTKKKNKTTEENEFEGVPLVAICQSIQLLLDELKGRGYKVYDFDNKNKSIEQIMIIKNKVFFLTAKEK